MTSNTRPFIEHLAEITFTTYMKFGEFMRATRTLEELDAAHERHANEILAPLRKLLAQCSVTQMALVACAFGGYAANASLIGDLREIDTPLSLFSMVQTAIRLRVGADSDRFDAVVYEIAKSMMSDKGLKMAESIRAYISKTAIPLDDMNGEDKELHDQ